VVAVRSVGFVVVEFVIDIVLFVAGTVAFAEEVVGVAFAEVVVGVAFADVVVGVAFVGIDLMELVDIADFVDIHDFVDYIVVLEDCIDYIVFVFADCIGCIVFVEWVVLLSVGEIRWHYAGRLES
jgi:hypothetical protein